jgi:hypothetical protein
MLKLSFLGCKSGFESMVYAQIICSGAENEDIYRDGGRESFRSYESFKNTETVMNDEEGRTRTMEDKYKGLRAHFASIELYVSPLDPHKIIHLCDIGYLGPPLISSS